MTEGVIKANYFCEKCGNYFALAVDNKILCPSCSSNLLSKVTGEFKWIGSDYVEYDPTEMETRHLFYTLKMIWNHSAPEHLKIRPYRKYNFDTKVYTKEYIKKAVRCLSKELSSRDDMSPMYIEVLGNIMSSIDEYIQGETNGPKRICGN